MKLEVGMYVRHHYYGIGKITNRYESSNKTWFNVKFKCDGEDEGNCGICEQSIGVKASNNIIDLIEVGDYVNGHQVYEVDRVCCRITLNGGDIGEEFRLTYLRPALGKNMGIKSIVTKEQFESMSYKVGK